MSKAVVILFVYALLILLGGIRGHAAGSQASLIMGLTFGILLLGSTFAIYKKKKAGVWMAVSLIIILDAFFTYRYSQTGRFMPSGMLSLISVITLFAFIWQIRKKPLRS